MATIEDLPKELMLQIFSHYVQSDGRLAFLRSIPRVCKHWNKLSSDSSLWRDVRTRDWNFLLFLSRRGLLYHTQKLKVNHSSMHVNAVSLSEVLEKIRDLKTLVLKTCVCNDAIKIVTEHCPHLERLCLGDEGTNTRTPEWDQFLTVCGPTLKDLSITYCHSEIAGQQLLSGIAAKCPLLERLELYGGYGTTFPVDELRSKYPRLKELKLNCCYLVTTGRNDSIGCGLKGLKKFTAYTCDFREFDLHNLLKDSVNLEHLKLVNNQNFTFENILKLPSGKVRILDIRVEDVDEELGDLIRKWRQTLSVLKINFWNHNIMTDLLDLYNVRNPQINWMVVWDNINVHFFDKFIRECQNVIHLVLGGKKFKGREEIEKTFGVPQERTV